MINHRINSKYLNLLGILIFVNAISLPIILNYGCMDGFVLKQIAFSQKCDKLGHLPSDDALLGGSESSIPGWHLLSIFISKLTGISYLKLIFIPFQSIAVNLLLLLILMQYNPSNIINPIIILFLSTMSTQAYFAIHEVGIVTFFLLVVLIFLLFKINDFHQRTAIFFLLVLTIFSLNLFSYKSTSFAFSLCIAIFFLTLKFKPIRRIFLNILLLFFTITLSFNEYIYREVIPIFRYRTDSISGFDKLSLFFNKQTPDMLGLYNFYDSLPNELSYLKIVRLATIFMIILVTIYLIIKLKFWQYKFLEFLKCSVFLGLLFVATNTLIAYNMLGLFDIGMIVYPGMIALSILIFKKILLHDEYTSQHLGYFFLIVLLILNAVSLIYISNNTTILTTDKNLFEYILPSVCWMDNYTSNNTTIKTDVLTSGYYNNIQVVGGYTNYPKIFSDGDILFLLNKDNSIKSKKVFFVTNLRVNTIRLLGWSSIKSFKFFEKELNSNINIQQIYSDSFIHVYTT